MTWTEALPLLLAVIAAIPGILALLKGRSKERADAAATITGSALELLEEYKTQVEEIEKTVEQQAEKIRSQDRKIAQQDGELALQKFELEKQAASIELLKEERDEIMKGVTALCTQIRNLGHEPVWEPAPIEG